MPQPTHTNIQAALHRRQEQEQRSGAGLPFCVPDALRFQAQVVESAELRTLSQAAPDKDGVVDGAVDAFLLSVCVHV